MGSVKGEIMKISGNKAIRGKCESGGNVVLHPSEVIITVSGIRLTGYITANFEENRLNAFDSIYPACNGLSDG